LTDVVTEFGLEVPYTSTRLQQSISVPSLDESECDGDEVDDVHENQHTHKSTNEKDGLLFSPPTNILHFLSRANAETKRNLQGDQILNTSSEPDTPAARSNNNYQPDDKIMQKVVTGLVRPINMLKNIVEVVSFQREDNVKHEVDLGVPSQLIEDLSIEHYQRLEDAFSYHDDGKKGYLSKSELRDCLRTLGHNFTEQQVWKLLAQVDVDHSGTLDFEEFFDLMSSMMCGWDPRTDLGICWRVLDPKGTGLINLQSLINLCRKYGAKVDDHEIEQMFTKYSQSDYIDFEQFYSAIIEEDSLDCHI